MSTWRPFLDRILISASLPVTLFEAGYPQLGINPSNAGWPWAIRAWAPKCACLVSPHRGPIALSLSADVWIPINSFPTASLSRAVGRERCARAA